MLIGVTVHAAEFLAIDASRPVLLFELAKGWLTGSEPDLGEMHHLDAPHRPAASTVSARTRNGTESVSALRAESATFL